MIAYFSMEIGVNSAKSPPSGTSRLLSSRFRRGSPYRSTGAPSWCGHGDASSEESTERPSLCSSSTRTSIRTRQTTVCFHFLYGGDAPYRLAQELVLGIGGVGMLRELGYGQIRRFHLNEGHSALLILELISERLRASQRTIPTEEDIESVRQMCVFTTHTPVPAAHDQFSPDLVERILSRSPMSQLMHRCCYGGALNMTYLALNFSHYVNGVPCAAAKSRARCLEGTTSTRSRLYEYCRDQRPSSRLRVEGKTYFQLERLGMPSRWNTLRALRVLKWWNRAETTGE